MTLLDEFRNSRPVNATEWAILLAGGSARLAIFGAILYACAYARRRAPMVVRPRRIKNRALRPRGNDRFLYMRRADELMVYRKLSREGTAHGLRAWIHPLPGGWQVHLPHKGLSYPARTVREVILYLRAHVYA